MSTSGSYSFTVNRGQIIRDAMLNIGRLDETEAPTAQETTDIAFKLNMLVKQWQGKSDFAPGLKVWTRRRGHLFLKGTSGPYVMGPSSTTGWTNDNPTAPVLTATAAGGATSVVVSSVVGLSTGMYFGVNLDANGIFWTTVVSVAGSTVNMAGALPSQCSTGAQVFAYTTIAQYALNISAVVLRDNQLTDVPLRLMTSEEYDLLSNKMDPQNTGDPTAVYTENQLGYTYLYTDIAIAQDTSKHLVITYMEPVQDVLQDSDNFEYPQEWFLALSWGLAKQICPQFSVNWTPLMQDNYTTALAIAGHKDAEITAMYFQSYDTGSN